MSGSLNSTLRERIYNGSLEAGLFYLIPFIAKLPDPVAELLITMKARIRFLLGTYRSYINRPGLKKAAIRNLAGTLALSDKEATEAIKKTFHLEVIGERYGYLFDRVSTGMLDKHFTINGIENLHNALKKEKGVLFVTIHAGFFELTGLYFSLMGYKIYGLFDGTIQTNEPANPLDKFAKLKDEKLTGRVKRIFTTEGIHVVFETLREQGIIYWLIDVPSQKTRKIKSADFLGKGIATDKGFWTVARKTGAVILPHISLYDFKTKKNQIYIGTPIDPAVHNIQDTFLFFEPFIQKSPENWMGWYYLEKLIC
jgi:lauroyl/myristoyl acyltransferase